MYKIEEISKKKKFTEREEPKNKKDKMQTKKKMFKLTNPLIIKLKFWDILIMSKCKPQCIKKTSQKPLNS
jgi:hypothetical protein